jgi:cell division septum initiation protein DivIVA
MIGADANASSTADAVHGELAELKRRVTEAEAQFTAAVQRVTAMEASTSWRATAPFRVLARALRRMTA